LEKTCSFTLTSRILQSIKSEFPSYFSHIPIVVEFPKERTLIIFSQCFGKKAIWDIFLWNMITILWGLNPYCSWKEFIYSIIVSEVKDTKFLYCKKHSCHLVEIVYKVNFWYFSKIKKLQKMQIVCYNILTIGVEIFQFHSKVISNLFLSLIKYSLWLNLFLIYIPHLWFILFLFELWFHLPSLKYNF